MVVFATPGMLHAGLSLQVFKKWAPDENNMLIMPGLVYNILLIFYNIIMLQLLWRCGIVGNNINSESQGFRFNPYQH